jgi:hypothetical protein
MTVTKIDETKSFIDFDVDIKNFTDVFSFSKEEFNKAFKEFEHWRNDLTATNFSVQLFRLICKADSENMAKFLRGFPEHTIVYLLWYESPTEDEFYEKWGNIKIEDVSAETIINNPTSELIEDVKRKQRLDAYLKDKEE